MTEFSINVNVGGCAKIELGVSPQLEKLLTQLLTPKEEKIRKVLLISDNPQHDWLPDSYHRVPTMGEAAWAVGEAIKNPQPTENHQEPQREDNAQQLLEEIKNQCDAAAHEPLTTETLLNTPIGELPSLLNQEPPFGEPPTLFDQEPLNLENITPPQEEQPSAPETFNELAMRRIMEETRKRVLGEDYTKEHPLYKRINGQFKTEASFASGGKCDKPSKLPELGADVCIAFRNACEGLAIDPVTNDIISKPPF